jgi:hypothetical protein
MLSLSKHQPSKAKLTLSYQPSKLQRRRSNLHAEPAEAPTLKSEANSTFSTFEASAKKVNLQSLRKNTYLYLLISFYF